MIAGSSLFFPWFIWNMLCWPCILGFWFQTDLGRENSASFLKHRRGRLFLTMVTRWPRSTSNFYALIGQNLTDELMPKIYAASWKLFTLTAEADGVLCQLVMCLTVFFHWMYKMKFSCYQDSSVIHGLFVYWVFGWEIRRLSKSEIRFRIASFSFSPCGRGLQSLKRYYWPYLIPFRNWIRMVSPGNYCIWCLFLFYLISWSRAQFMRQVYARF